MTDEELGAILAEAVEAYRKLPKRIGVSPAMLSIASCEVIEIEDCPEDQKLVAGVCAAAALLISRSRDVPIKTTRINELGNAIEEPLLQACLDSGLDASWPLRPDGTTSRNGYPDLAIGLNGGRPSYLEAKVVKANSENSSFRAFYMSPSERPKVCCDARHLLLAFTHKRRGNNSDGFEQYELLDFKLVDLARVIGKVKFEYQASNRDMYMGSAVLARG